MYGELYYDNKYRAEKCHYKRSIRRKDQIGAVYFNHNSGEKFYMNQKNVLNLQKEKSMSDG